MVQYSKASSTKTTTKAKIKIFLKNIFKMINDKFFLFVVILGSSLVLVVEHNMLEKSGPVMQKDMPMFHPSDSMSINLRFRKCTSPESNVPWPFHDEFEYQNIGPNPIKDAASPVVSSLFNPHLKCGLGLKGHSGKSGVRFIEYFQNTIKKELIQPILDKEGCEDMVVFGAAFGEKYVHTMRIIFKRNMTFVPPEVLVKKHGRCFFMFTNPEQKDPDEKPVAEQVGHYWFIPLFSKYLPYENNRRNAKLIKYMGHHAFLNHLPDGSDKVELPSPKNIVWQDAKFFREIFMTSMPTDYNPIIRPKDSNTYSFPDSHPNPNMPCLSTIALPVDPGTFGVSPQNGTSDGLYMSSYTRVRYKDHCATIIAALQARPGVTDCPEALIGQCEIYSKYVEDEQKYIRAAESEKEKKGDNSEERDALHYGLIDTAFIVWNESTRQCRDFNAILRCTMLDQLECHSDRDQVLFPIVVHEFLSPEPTSGAQKEPAYSLKPVYYNHWTKTQNTVDKNWIPHAHDLDLVDRNPSSHDHAEQQIYMRMQRASCHWYFFKYMPNQPLGKRTCGHKLWLLENLKQDNPSLEQEVEIAVLMDDYKLSEIKNHSNFLDTTPMLLASERGHVDMIEAPYAADFYKCTSSEHDKVPWTFQEKSVEGKEPLLSCGTDKENLSTFHKKLQEKLVDTKILPYANEQECNDYVLFGAAFHSKIEDLRLQDDEEMIRQRKRELDYFNHKNCSFLFVLEKSLPTDWKERKKFSGNYRLIPVSEELLPYKSMTRNSKLFKYSGQFFFPKTKAVIYQDPDTFLSTKYINRQPITLDYLYPRSDKIPDRCVTIFSLPFVKSSAGNNHTEVKRNLEFFPARCKHLINMLESQSQNDGFCLHSDDSSMIIQQCDAYLQFVYKRELNTAVLDQGMADTNFIIWNESDDFCRKFNAKLRCIILDQLHCHSSNDELVFPFALYVNQMGQGSITEYDFIDQNGTFTRQPVDFEFVKKDHNLNYFVKQESDKSMDAPTKRDVVQIIRDDLHWMNYTSECKDDKTFYYKNKEQNCYWVGTKVKRCNWMKDDHPLKYYCPESCAECVYKKDCVDDKKFRYRNDKQHCGWVGGKLKRCKWPKDGKKIKYYCPETCNMCQEMNDGLDATAATIMKQDVLYSDSYTKFKKKNHQIPDL